MELKTLRSLYVPHLETRNSRAQFEMGQRITAPCKAIESSRFGWSCVSTSDSRSSGAQAVSPNAPGPPSIRGRCRSTRTVRRSSRPEYSRSGCCRRQHLRDDRSSRLSLMAILSSMLLGTANYLRNPRRPMTAPVEPSSHSICSSAMLRTLVFPLQNSHNSTLPLPCTLTFFTTPPALNWDSESRRV